MKWINVKEALPPTILERDIFNRPCGYYSKRVLVCVESNECDGIHRYVAIDYLRGHSLEDIDWMMSCGYGGSAVYSQKITHWMPLPVTPL